MPALTLFMNKRQRYFLAVGGIVGLVVGLTWAIPSVLQAAYGIAIVSTFFIAGGFIALAFAFGE